MKNLMLAAAMAAVVLVGCSSPKAGFSESKAWIKGKVLLDSGSSRIITYYSPDLKSSITNQSSRLSHIHETNGSFIMEFDINGPSLASFRYDDHYLSVYLIPEDTLVMEFDAANLEPTLRWTGGRTAEINRQLSDFAFISPGLYIYPRGGRTAEDFRRETKKLEAVHKAKIDSIARARGYCKETVNLLTRNMEAIMAGYTDRAFISGYFPSNQIRELYKDWYPADDDNFLAFPVWWYYLRQVAGIPIHAGSGDVETFSLLDSTIANHPAGLSRDVMNLQLFSLVFFRNSEADFDKAYANADKYIQDSVARAALDYFVEYKKAGAGAKTPNAYRLNLKKHERFIADIFAPFENKGKALYVDVWGVGCGPCYEQMPRSIQMHEHFRGQDVEFLYICTGSTPDGYEQMRKKLGIRDIGNHMLLDSDQSAILMEYFGFTGIPRYWIIDKDGTMVDNNAPRPSEDAAWQKLEELAAK